MAEARRGFEVIENDDAPERAPVQEKTSSLNAILVLFKALSQRALADVFALISMVLTFWLWQSTPSPTSYQLVELGMFAGFVLIANVIVRRA